ncbi:hypothetical protein IFM89_010735 [Coptis chinensis]|uniref:peptidylprolyl isomerase n=1 Tax=Coptis chinensis TaxID=261450 RepID=A0A835ILL9_9MAGN|nr:hypothetical protein IFM89_010735 [Coptis chinensis]
MQPKFFFGAIANLIDEVGGAIVHIEGLPVNVSKGHVNFLPKPPRSMNCVSEDDELFEFKTDEEQVIDGLDRAVMTMKKGEVVESTIALEYGFGSSEFKQELAVVTPNSTMKLSLNPLSRLAKVEAKGLQTSRKLCTKTCPSLHSPANLDIAGIDIKVLEIDPNTGDEKSEYKVLKEKNEGVQ